MFSHIPLLHDDAPAQDEKVLPEGVDDIDAADQDDPQLVSAYVDEIMSYQRKLELKQSVAAQYMNGVQTDITPSMRTILVDWCVTLLPALSRHTQATSNNCTVEFLGIILSSIYHTP